jgi:glutaryl-CoA dehydrogenase
VETCVLRNEGRATTAQISMAKRNNVDMATLLVRQDKFLVEWESQVSTSIAHMMNLESVITYEGNTRYSLTYYRNGYHWNPSV